MNKEYFKYPKEQEGVIDGFYNEIFNEAEYDRYGAKVEAGDVVIDCGAFVGMFTHFALMKGAKQVYSIESEKSHYDCLVENTKDSHRVKTYHGRVPDDYSIEQVLNENNLAYVDYVKMDIEGAEYPCLINMSDETLKRANKWTIEFHPGWQYEGAGEKWEHGYDLSSHYVSKLLYVMERFTVNGFKIGYEHIHKDYNITMLYAWK